MVTVYHNKEFMFKKPEEIDKSLLTKVAEIEINDLETAFELTNHIDKPWTENDKVTPLVSNPRSTSAGDVMEIDGQFYFVASTGFTKINLK